MALGLRLLPFEVCSVVVCKGTPRRRSQDTGGFTILDTVAKSSVRVHFQAGRAGHRLVPLLFGRLVAMLGAVALVALVPLAHASPPDPTWIPGLYDNADHDDAVLAGTEGVGFPANDGPANVTSGTSSTPIAFVDPT